MKPEVPIVWWELGLLYLLAEGGSPKGDVVSESIFKYIIGGLGGAVLGMAGFIWYIINRASDDKDKVTDRIKTAEDAVRANYRSVLDKIQEQHAAEKAKLEQKAAEAEKKSWSLLEEQLRDAKDNDGDYEKLCADYEKLVSHLSGLVAKNNELMASSDSKKLVAEVIGLHESMEWVIETLEELADKKRPKTRGRHRRPMTGGSDG